MIIGLTGKNASGKGAVADFLKSRGFTFYSLSDALRDELKKTKKPVSRDNLTWLGNKLRNEFGPSILAERILEKIETDHHYVIDSFRNPEEVKTFRRTNNFKLIVIEAQPKKRFERIKTRNRENDPKTYEQFLKVEDAESHNSDPTKQNLEACARLADTHLKNDGSLEALHRDITKLVTKILMESPRPSWDIYFMKIARVVASRSNCMKRKVAAVIVSDGRIISTGYNGTPRGTTNCNEGGCPRCNAFNASGAALSDCYCSHAEENAIVQASYHGIPIKNAVLYTTFSPCLLCTKMIINSGIKEVVYNEAYTVSGESLRLLKQSSINARRISTHEKQS